jgi:FtsH-binding integral membrane protein
MLLGREAGGVRMRAFRVAGQTPSDAARRRSSPCRLQDPAHSAWQVQPLPAATIVSAAPTLGVLLSTVELTSHRRPWANRLITTFSVVTGYAVTSSFVELVRGSRDPERFYVDGLGDTTVIFQITLGAHILFAAALLYGLWSGKDLADAGKIRRITASTVVLLLIGVGNALVSALQFGHEDTISTSITVLGSALVAGAAVLTLRETSRLRNQ